MKKLFLLLVMGILSLSCNASDAVKAKYSISSMYSGTIGKSNITMNLVISDGNVSGSYIYNKYKNKILLSGVIDSNIVKLIEKTNNSAATITLFRASNGYTGQWCNKKCVPVIIQVNSSFKDGELKDVKVEDSDLGVYKVDLIFKDKNESVIVTDAIDPPSLDFLDINGDGFYDLIVRTDHRPNNGSQVIYLSGNNEFIKDNDLSKENGTAVYDPYKKNIVFNSKNDCCNKFRKVIYSLDNGDFVRVDDLFFDYSSNKGKDSKGGDISKDRFESY